VLGKNRRRARDNLALAALLEGVIGGRPGQARPGHGTACLAPAADTSRSASRRWLGAAWCSSRAPVATVPALEPAEPAAADERLAPPPGPVARRAAAAGAVRAAAAGQAAAGAARHSGGQLPAGAGQQRRLGRRSSRARRAAIVAAGATRFAGPGRRRAGAAAARACGACQQRGRGTDVYWQQPSCGRWGHSWAHVAGQRYSTSLWKNASTSAPYG
jgi:hypothetical protein